MGQGKHAEAEQITREVLAVRKRVLGPEHPETLRSAGNLASSLCGQGKHVEAEQIALDSGGSIARLSGIYGPGRSVLLKKFLSGEALLEEKASIAALFGPMLEQGFSPMLGGPVLRAVPVFDELLQNDALVIDLGCGNGWYLRVLAQRFPALRGLGIDGMAENIDGATASAEAAGLSARLRFLRGDVLSLGPTEPATLIAMNRALHHVWDRQIDVMAAIFDRLRPGGAAVIWEPAWPADPRSLRTEGRPGITWNNILEHAQGNHLLRPDEIAAAAAAAGLVPTIHPVGFDVVVVARRPA
jgi:SAM-dependent methyltransferase